MENQQHRLVVSGMDIPAGMKNPDQWRPLTVMLQLRCCGTAWTLRSFTVDWEVEDYRKSLDTYHFAWRSATSTDNCIPNYHYEDLKLASVSFIQRA